MKGNSRAPAAENTGAKQLDVFFIKGKSRAPPPPPFPAAENTGAQHSCGSYFPAQKHMGGGGGGGTGKPQLKKCRQIPKIILCVFSSTCLKRML